MPVDDSTLLFGSFPQTIDRKPLRAIAKRLRSEVAKDRPFCLYLTDDQELQRLNRDFLHNDYPTDVLSFPSGELQGDLGEIAISVERAFHQSQQYGHTVEEEIQILMLHGLLHLVGMDHETDQGEMASAEQEWRKRLSLPAGLIERVRP